jgi:predicted O-methyltransferase YrrM
MKARIANVVHAAVHAALRAVSSEHRAHTDLFVRKYADRVDWKSGVGEGLHTLYGLARSLRPTVVVETGSARGKSTCALALACRQNGHGKVYAIDPHLPNDWSEYHTDGDNLSFLRRRLADYGLDGWCEVIRGTSETAAKTWDKPIDLLWIDGDHTYDGVKLDFELFGRFLKPTALVVFHDSMWEYLRGNEYYREDMGVPRFLAELKDRGYHSVTLPCVPGMTVLQPRVGGFDFVPAAEPAQPAFVC